MLVDQFFIRGLMVDFFGRELGATLAAEGVQADVIHANNVIAHIPDVNGVFAGIKAVLKRTAMGKLVKARGYTC
mgnify:CR=1 FL=1